MFKATQGSHILWSELVEIQITADRAGHRDAERRRLRLEARVELKLEGVAVSELQCPSGLDIAAGESGGGAPLAYRLALITLCGVLAESEHFAAGGK